VFQNTLQLSTQSQQTTSTGAQKVLSQQLKIKLNAVHAGLLLLLAQLNQPELLQDWVLDHSQSNNSLIAQVLMEIKHAMVVGTTMLGTT